MNIEFTKWHGLGNDFVIIDCRQQAFNPNPLQIQKIANRHHGIGCDQVLLIEHSPDSHADVFYRIFNADGYEVEQCGNGARCVAAYLFEKSQQPNVTIRTTKQLLKASIFDTNANLPKQVSVDMGAPKILGTHTLTLPNHHQTIELGLVDMGNPHAVFVCQTLKDALNDSLVTSLGPMIATHRDFPQGINAGFMQIITPHHLHLRVHERGVGETQACGTGACAAAAWAIHTRLCQTPITVQLLGGTLTIDWQGENQPLVMTGPAQEVFKGEFNLEEFFS